MMEAARSLGFAARFVTGYIYVPTRDELALPHHLQLSPVSRMPTRNRIRSMGYTDLLRGQQYVADLVKAVQGSAVWKDSVIIITYDEAGGRWDHVPPPRGDRWGPGVRVPAIIISPYAKRRFVDNTTYETTSILKFIETRWDLAPLGSRDAAANNLLNAFDFSQTP
jgi:phospholipase C